VSRYDDVLAPAPRPATPPVVEAEVGLVVEDEAAEFCGAVVSCDKDMVTLEDRFGRTRVFPLRQGGFLLEGKLVTLVRPQSPAAGSAPAPTRTASGSTAVRGVRARIARGSRIYVEGRHDAELVEKVWGDDLRIEGVVVEYLEGVDNLPDVVRAFAPGHGRRLGVLVDHLVSGSKESRIAAAVASPNVLVVGHPYVDVWQAVRPSALGIAQWPAVDRGILWKVGICEAFGWAHETPADLAAAWRRILRAVSSYADLEPALLGRVEELIDFVTAPA
jgi:hypothetical protein